MMGCLKRIVLIGLAFLLLAGRVSAEDREERDARDHATCVGRGEEVGTDGYTACRAELTAERKAAEIKKAQENMENYRRHVGR
jgi:hypothetical protein